MKIAFISAACSIHTVKWVNALAKRGHTVRLYSMPDHMSLQKNIDPRVETVYLSKRGFAGYFLNAEELSQSIREFSPDIINAHYASGYGTLARRSNVHPLVLSVWGSDVYDFPKKSALHRYLVEKNLNSADAVASTSEAMAKQVHRMLRYANPITVTPFGVNCEKFAPTPRGSSIFTVGTVKALEDKYGIEYLIKAFADFEKSLPNGEEARLQIYGKGSREKNLQELINQMGLSQKAKLMGAIPNAQVPQVINEMDVLVLPSVLDSESFGVSAVEAMACAVPVIASDVDGFKETVEDTKTGFLVPRRDSNAIAQKIEMLYKSDDLRSRLGQAGRKRVLDFYDFSKNVDTMVCLYRNVISEYKKK